MKVSNTMRCLGTNTHTDHDREQDDFYATEPIAAELLLEAEPELNNIWEPAVGEKHLANVFESHGKLGRMSDIVKRCDDERIEVKDFLTKRSGLLNSVEREGNQYEGDIVTNPPFKLAVPFIKRGLELVPDGRKVCMFLKLQFLEGQERKEFFKQYPPKTVYVSSSRIACAMNGEFMKLNKKTGKMEKIANAVAYAWFVWEKGFKGDPVIKWIN